MGSFQDMNSTWISSEFESEKSPRIVTDCTLRHRAAFDACGAFDSDWQLHGGYYVFPPLILSLMQCTLGISHRVYLPRMRLKLIALPAALFVNGALLVDETTPISTGNFTGATRYFVLTGTHCSLGISFRHHCLIVLVITTCLGATIYYKEISCP